MVDVLKNKKVTLFDLQENEYVINQFGNEIKGILKLNNKLHIIDFKEETNKLKLKSENNIVINDGISDRVIIGDIGKVKDGSIYGIKVSSPGYDARHAPKENLFLDSSTNVSIFYKIFNHNFQDNLDTSEHFLPMHGTGESSTMNDRYTAFLVPYKMTLKKIILRPETIADANATLTFKIKKQINGSVSVVTVATFEYDTELASNTLLQVNESDFDNSPTVVAGEKLAISIEADADPDGSSTIDYYITSVWKTEILL